MKKIIKIGEQKKKSADAEVMTLLGKSGHIVKVFDSYLSQARSIDNMIKKDLDYGLEEGTRDVAIDMLNDMLEDYELVGRFMTNLKDMLEKIDYEYRR